LKPKEPIFTPNPANIVSIKEAAAKSASNSKAASPKSKKNKVAAGGDEMDLDVTPPPLPGQGGVFGKDGKDGNEHRAPTVIIHFPLKGATNQYLNFSRIAEEKYGWDAMHPRLAAQRDRLARIAAAGAALERSGGTAKEEGDESASSESEDEGKDSNVEMGGMSATDGKPAKAKPKRKMREEYDKDDGFVDDSDLVWEETAAASVDGFFVYSGPLVPEGETPVLEGREPAKKTRGRGGGRGTGRGGGPGSRGGAVRGAGRGGTTERKPRITKADRAKREAEKLERERLGRLSATAGVDVMLFQNSATPAVFGN
jgi:hypothetical protein